MTECQFGWGYYWWGINKNQTPRFTSNSLAAWLLSECCHHNGKVKNCTKNKAPPPNKPLFPQDFLLSMQLLQLHQYQVIHLTVCPVYSLASANEKTHFYFRLPFPITECLRCTQAGCWIWVAVAKGAISHSENALSSLGSAGTRAACSHILQNMWSVISQAFLPPSII